MNGSGQASGIVLLTVVVVVAVLRVAQEVFIPLALAMLLTFMLAPLVSGLRRLRIRRGLAVLVSLAIGLSVIGLLGDLVVNQVADLARSLPNYQRQLNHNINELRGILRGGVAETTKVMGQITKEIQRVTPPEPRTPGVARVQVVETPQTPLETLRDIAVPLLKPIGTAIVLIVLVAFMLMRLPDLRERIVVLLGARNLHMTTEALEDAGSRISRYLLMQLLINGWTGAWVAFGLWMLGVPNAALWGALTLVLRFIPYVGSWLAAAMPFVLSFAVFDDWTRPVMVLGLFAILELFSYAVLEPWLYGSHTGLSPVALLLAAAFWTWVWGFAGLFLAVPLTVCAAVMGKYIPQLNFLYVLLGDQPVLEPHERLYQRLLGSGRDEADRLLESVRRSKTLLEACDAVIVPAMQMVESDHDRGSLSDSRREAVLQHIDDWAEERFDQLYRSTARTRDLRHGPPPAVVCVAAADRADEIIARLLAAALLEQGFEGAVGRIEKVEQELPAARADGRVRAIVVSALPPQAVAPARAICKRVTDASPVVETSEPDEPPAEPAGTLPLIVGLWNDGGDLRRARERLESAGATRIVTTFADCLRVLQAPMEEQSFAALPDEVRAEAEITQT
jgi:predicted PurR-regulated permease PerM